MDDERWHDLVEQIERKLKVLGKETYTQDEGRTEIETLTFQGPEGKMMLRRTSKPLVVDKKVQFSKRIGSHRSVEYVYSPSEKVQRVQLFKWSETDRDWEEVRLDRFVPQ
ncbi:MAG: hypothetical protein JSW03_07475 [Candidatus Eiseniibacteriota bacterium]|nr:MAG: hypothetical protein JSW03_07475 [Candidatus Eisenbacteria bacterium]